MVQNGHENTMKVNIGKYPEHINAYMLVSWYAYVGIPDEKVTWIGEWLSCCKLLNCFLEWFNRMRTRRIKVHIHGHDVWSMDHTLSLIIVPMLEKLKGMKHGSAAVDDEDVPEEYKTKDVHERWEWTLNEMLWAFTQIRDNEDDPEYNSELQLRMINGTKLFGKYYFALWD
jgi:hypothetical protein